MSFQPLFRRFHEAIQLRRLSQGKELYDKAERVLTRMREKKMPSKFESFPQGSYAMDTGVRRLDGDYDIDVGIIFPINPGTVDPCAVKGWVFEAVKDHTARVEWRRPCITVYYQKERELLYHVDLAILAKDPTSGRLKLALGKQHSAVDQRQWQPDDRKGFMAAVENCFSGEEATQFRRVIRYLKRWRDVHFPREGRAAPTGLAFTVAALRWFQPRRAAGDYDDLGAILALASSLRQSFTQTRDNATGGWIHRLALQFPNEPYDDILARMNNQQMQELYQRLEKLIGWLEEAQRTGSVAPLRRAFGDDFPER